MNLYIVTKKVTLHYGAVVKANSAAEARRYASEYIYEEPSERGRSETKWKSQPVTPETRPHDYHHLEQHDATTSWGCLVPNNV